MDLDLLSCDEHCSLQEPPFTGKWHGLNKTRTSQVNSIVDVQGKGAPMLRLWGLGRYHTHTWTFWEIQKRQKQLLATVLQATRLLTVHGSGRASRALRDTPSSHLGRCLYAEVTFRDFIRGRHASTTTSVV